MKESFTKLITDSDADGIVCAAMLLRVFPGMKVYFSSPSAFQDGLLPTEVNSETIVSDLPFMEGCGMYFDHHISNKPEKPVQGMWEPAPSAARVICEYYKKQVPLTDFEEFLPILDRFDSGALTHEDVKNPSFYLKLIYATKKVTHQFYKHLVELLTQEGPVALQDDPMVISEIGEFEKSFDLMQKDIKNIADKRGDSVFINLIDKPYSNIHVSILQSQFIDSKIFVLYKKDKTAVRVTLFDNNLKQDSKRYDLLSIARKMNPTRSGGHRSGCGFTLPEGMTIEECTEKLDSLFKELLQSN